jgi:hypothetical protein
LKISNIRRAAFAVAALLAIAGISQAQHQAGNFLEARFHVGGIGSVKNTELVGKHWPRQAQRFVMVEIVLTHALFSVLVVVLVLELSG